MQDNNRKKQLQDNNKKKQLQDNNIKETTTKTIICAIIKRVKYNKERRKERSAMGNCHTK